MHKISIGSRMTSQLGPNSIEIKGLTHEEMGQLLGAIRGLSWFKVEEGRLKASSCHIPLPDPVHDELMLPFWRQFEHHQLQGELLEKLFEEMCGDVIYMPHFTIQHLCGHNYTPENYVREAEKLTSYGFIQLRSKRGEDGGFWELWYLPGVWCAKGDLKAYIDGITAKAKSWEDPSGKLKDKECFKAVLEFLRRNTSFGTLDVSVQRLCQVLDD